MQAEGPDINVSLPSPNWQELIPELVGYFFEGLGTFLNELLHETFDGVWGSGANVIGQTPLDMTWAFGPVADQVASVQGAARAVFLFAVVLLGLKSMLGGIVRRDADWLSEATHGLLVAILAVTGFSIFVPEVIRLANAAATAVGTADLAPYLSSGTGTNPIVQAVLFVILLFFAGRLLVKAVWRVVFLAVLLPVGMVAAAMYAIPATRWLLAWWLRIWGGMLLAQIPSVFALSIGSQLFAFGGVLGFLYAIACLQLATDLYSLIPFGHVPNSGPPWSVVPFRALAGWAALGAASRSAAALPRSQIAADMYGYGR
jgi:hypothetical protein